MLAVRLICSVLNYFVFSKQLNSFFFSCKVFIGTFTCDNMPYFLPTAWTPGLFFAKTTQGLILLIHGIMTRKMPYVYFYFPQAF